MMMLANGPALLRLFARRQLNISYFHEPDDERQKMLKGTRFLFRIVSPRQTTKADVLYVPGVNLQLITQERDHKDAHNRACPVFVYI